MTLPPYIEVKLADGRFQVGTDEDDRLYVAVQGKVLAMTDFVATRASTQQLRQIAQVCIVQARREERKLR